MLETRTLTTRATRHAATARRLAFVSSRTGQQPLDDRAGDNPVGGVIWDVRLTAVRCLRSCRDLDGCSKAWSLRRDRYFGG